MKTKAKRRAAQWSVLRTPRAKESGPVNVACPLEYGSNSAGQAHFTGQGGLNAKAETLKPEILKPEGDLRLLTAEDISARLFIKPRTAALWARQGRLPAYRIGRKLGFKWEEVERALPKTKS
jgi:excisionase family DNA binding protein